MKRFKIGVVGASRVCMASTLVSFLSMALQIFLHCDNAEVAGLTVAYKGYVEL